LAALSFGPNRAQSKRLVRDCGRLACVLACTVPKEEERSRAWMAVLAFLPMKGKVGGLGRLGGHDLCHRQEEREKQFGLGPLWPGWLEREERQGD